jgi:hypothetical protein
MSYHDQYLPEDAHGPYRQLFANAAARTADATVYSAQDVASRIKALQLDTLREYVLTVDTPVWTPVSGGSVFGEDYAMAASNGRSTTTSTTFQMKTAMSTPVLTGTYRIMWTAVVDQSLASNRVESRLQDTTNALTLLNNDDVSIHEPKDFRNRIHVGTSIERVFVAETINLEIQYRQQAGSTAGISNARIEIWRVG